MNEAVIAKLRSLWADYSSQANFEALGKLVRSSFKLVDLRRAPDMVAEIEKMTTELERYIPLMGLKEFVYCTQAIKYARQQIENRRGKQYASGLSRALTDADRAELLRISRAQSDRSLGQNGSNHADGALDVDDSDDDDDS